MKVKLIKEKDLTGIDGLFFVFKEDLTLLFIGCYGTWKESIKPETKEKKK